MKTLKVINEQPDDVLFSREIQTLVKCWNTCILQNVDCVEIQNTLVTSICKQN